MIEAMLYLLAHLTPVLVFVLVLSARLAWGLGTFLCITAQRLSGIEER